MDLLYKAGNDLPRLQTMLDELPELHAVEFKLLLKLEQQSAHVDFEAKISAYVAAGAHVPLHVKLTVWSECLSTKLGLPTIGNS
jgi:hypothetical protein